MTPEQLSRLIDGDDRAWRTFVLRWSNLIFSVVLRTLGSQQNSSREEVEDVCQDVFLRLTRDGFRLLRRFDPERASFATWLHLVARSTAVDHLRRRRDSAVPLEAIEEPGITDSEPDMEHLSLPAGILSPRQQLVLKLLLEKDLSPQEVADFLKINVQTVHSLKHKALKKIRHFLRNGGEI